MKCDLLGTPLDGRRAKGIPMGNEWAVRVVWAGSCGLPLTIFVSSLFERVCKLSFKFQICKNMNLFDMINFDLKAH